MKAGWATWHNLLFFDLSGVGHPEIQAFARHDAKQGELEIDG